MEILGYAEDYRAAALKLLAPGAKKAHRMPGRFCAIHGIELYLNAFLLSRGEPHSGLRALHHDMAARADLAKRHGMAFRKKTAEHLIGLSDSREYLTVRYAPELEMNLSQVNRLTATLDQVACAVRSALVTPFVQAGAA
jgi:hypothetical protein